MLPTICSIQIIGQETLESLAIMVSISANVGRYKFAYSETALTVGFLLMILTSQWLMIVIGHKMAGVSGTEQDGTYSIVVAGAYNEVDRDEGDILYYSGPGSHENESPEKYNLCKPLERSLSTRRPVRVFRSAKGKWKGSPSAGLRYDGLYTVVSLSIQKNGLGGKYQQFKLLRVEDQRPIDQRAPSQSVKNAYERVALGYTHRRPGPANPPSQPRQ